MQLMLTLQAIILWYCFHRASGLCPLVQGHRQYMASSRSVPFYLDVNSPNPGSPVPLRADKSGSFLKKANIRWTREVQGLLPVPPLLGYCLSLV